MSENNQEHSIFHENLSFQIEQKFAFTAKNLIVYFEILKDNGVITEEVFQNVRKRIFDHCGNSWREIKNMLDKLEVDIKK